ncbi:MAG: hypothetical protein ACAI38_04160 [Myxococcota bacterium]
MEKVSSRMDTIVNMPVGPTPIVVRALAGSRLTEAIDKMVAKHPRPVLQELRRATRTDHVLQRLGNAGFYAASFAGLSILVELGGRILIGGGAPDPAFVGVIAALGGAFGVSLPIDQRPLKRTKANEEALGKAGAVITAMAYNVELSPEAAKSFKGVGGYKLGSPSVLSLVFDKAAFKDEHAEEVRAGIEKQLDERGMTGLAPDFVRFKVTFWELPPRRAVREN